MTLVDRMLAGEPVREVLRGAIACTVTVEEHKLLTKLSQARSELESWNRYEAAGIEVVDRGE